MSPAEMVTIALVVLLVFGPDRLPEMLRKIGKVIGEVSRAAQELKTGVEREFNEASQPLKEVRRQLGATTDDKPAAPPRAKPETPQAEDPPVEKEST